MTESIVFGSLESVPLRSAWAHEAHRFTPWLAENIAGLSAAIGIPLEVTGTEVPIDTFSADILARNLQDDSIVLIENQLDEGDHRHLGQIMTYLAGLGAHIVVWVAREFRDPHLSAIRWLNEHTADPYSFFAVRVRVVRIANSPYAPLFDVLERPNGWDRTLQDVARETRDLSSLGKLRKAFWTHLISRHPAEAAFAPPTGNGYRWRTLAAEGIVVAQYIAKDEVGVFVRGASRTSIEIVVERFEPFSAELAARLDAPMTRHSAGWVLQKKLPVDIRNEANWDRMADWLHTEADAYEAAIREILTAAD